MIRSLLEGEAPPTPAPTSDQFDAWERDGLARAKEVEEERQPGVYDAGAWSLTYRLAGVLDLPTRLTELQKNLEAAPARSHGLARVVGPPDLRDQALPDGRRARVLDGAERSIPCGSLAGLVGRFPVPTSWLPRGWCARSITMGTARHRARSHPPSVAPWRGLLHAAGLANLLGDASATVTFRARWRGLAGRTLVSRADVHRHVRERRSRQDEVSATIEVAADEIPASPLLVENLTVRLYEAFDLFAPPAAMFDQELAKLRKRTS